MDCLNSHRRANQTGRSYCQVLAFSELSIISLLGIGPKTHAVLLLSLLVVPLSTQPVSAGTDAYHLSLPNTDTGFERVLGVGVAFPYPYFQRPAHRYPVYDREGRGSLLYGYGGDDVYPYRVFDPVEGYHKK